jgi:hypothetical protein
MLRVSRAIGNAAKGETMKNEERGNTIAFESPERLAEAGPATGHAVVPGATGKTFAEITRAKSIEYKPVRGETIPETVSLDQLTNNAMRTLHGQYEPL